MDFDAGLELEIGSLNGYVCEAGPDIPPLFSST
jgi:hypothetical protein